MIETMIDILATPEAWTKGAFARTAKGHMIGSDCENAACFCLEGAGARLGPGALDKVEPLIAAAIYEMFPQRDAGGSLPFFNDHPDTTHEDVLAVLHRARELELAAEQEGAR